MPLNPPPPPHRRCTPADRCCMAPGMARSCGTAPVAAPKSNANVPFVLPSFGIGCGRGLSPDQHPLTRTHPDGDGPSPHHNTGRKGAVEPQPPPPTPNPRCRAGPAMPRTASVERRGAGDGPARGRGGPRPRRSGAVPVAGAASGVKRGFEGARRRRGPVRCGGLLGGADMHWNRPRVRDGLRGLVSRANVGARARDFRTPAA